MLTSPQSLVIGADTISVNRINQDNYASQFFGTKADNTIRVTLTVQHTIPKKNGGSGESHMARVDAAYYDALGVYIRTSTVWMVLRTSDAAQNDTTSKDGAVALATWLTASTNANLLAILARRS